MSDLRSTCTKDHSKFTQEKYLLVSPDESPNSSPRTPKHVPRPFNTVVSYYIVYYFYIFKRKTSSPLPDAPTKMYVFSLAIPSPQQGNCNKCPKQHFSVSSGSAFVLFVLAAYNVHTYVVMGRQRVRLIVLLLLFARRGLWCWYGVFERQQYVGHVSARFTVKINLILRLHQQML